MVSDKHKILLYIILLLDTVVIIFSTIYFYTSLGKITQSSSIKDSISYISNVKIQNNLTDFYKSVKRLDRESDSIISLFDKDELIGQQIVTSLGSNGKKWEEVKELMLKKRIGGVLLTGATIIEEENYVRRIRETEKENKLIPLLISFDGEPNLINKRFNDSNILPSDVKIQSISELNSNAFKISKLLNNIGVNQNYAPVCDVSVKGSFVDKRCFSNDINIVRIYSLLFSTIMQQEGIIATGKHFPGHGNVVGDSHKEIVFIDGELKELSAFKYLIDNNILSIMVGHIAIKNNPKYDTENLPSSLSEKIVTGLLRKELGFRGIIITDAMNMGAVMNLNKPSLNAIKAGCDMVLMPSDELKLIESVKQEIENNKQLDIQIHNSVRRIIKLKKCLGLI